MARLTPQQKAYRADARYWGEACATAVRLCTIHRDEACPELHRQWVEMQEDAQRLGREAASAAFAAHPELREEVHHA